MRSLGVIGLRSMRQGLAERQLASNCFKPANAGLS